MLTERQRTTVVRVLSIATANLSRVSLVMAEGMKTLVEEAADGVPVPPGITAKGNVENAILILKINAILDEVEAVRKVVATEVRIRKETVDLRNMKGVG